MTALEKWKNDFKEFISELSIPRDDYKGIMEYINEVPNEALEQQPCEDWYDVPSDDMTLEQARQAVKDLRKKLVEYLMQEPCDDCISRQAVFDGLASIAKVKARSDAQKSLMGRIMFFVEQLPSVTPKEKTGKWESTEIFYGGESKGAIIKCSECGNEFKVSPKVFENLYGNERFCNYCGVRMVSE